MEFPSNKVVSDPEEKDFVTLQVVKQCYVLLLLKEENLQFVQCNRVN